MKWKQHVWGNYMTARNLDFFVTCNFCNSMHLLFLVTLNLVQFLNYSLIKLLINRLTFVFS